MAPVRVEIDNIDGFGFRSKRLFLEFPRLKVEVEVFAERVVSQEVTDGQVVSVVAAKVERFEVVERARSPFCWVDVDSRIGFDEVAVSAKIVRQS